MSVPQTFHTSTCTLAFDDANWLVHGALEHIQQDLTQKLTQVSHVTQSLSCPRAYGALVSISELHGLLDAPTLSENGVDLALVLHLPPELEPHMLEMVGTPPQWHVLPTSCMSGHASYLSWQAALPTIEHPVAVLVRIDSLLPVIGVRNLNNSLQLANQSPKSLPLVLVPAQRRPEQSVVVTQVPMDRQLRSRCLMGLRSQSRQPDLASSKLAHAQAALLHSDLHWLFKTHMVMSRNEYLAAIAAPIVHLHSLQG